MIPGIPGMHFETDPGIGGGGGGVGTVEPSAPVDPAVAPAVEPVAQPAPATPEFNYDDPRLQDLIQTQASQIAQQTLQEMVQRAQAQQPQQAQQFDAAALADEYGNINPSALAAYIQAQNQQTLAAVQNMFQPVAQTLAQQQEQETILAGESRLEDILADDIARNGDFVRAAGNEPEQVAQAQTADATARQMVRTIADQLFPQIAQRYGTTPRAAEMAMSQAADQVRTLLRATGQSAQAQQANQLATLASQNGEVGSPGTQALSRPVVKFGERVVDRYASPALSQ